MLKLKSSDADICLDNHEDVEFDDWKWVDFWDPIDAVIYFKKDIYEDMLKALASVLFENEHRMPAKFSRPLKCSAIKISV